MPRLSRLASDQLAGSQGGTDRTGWLTCHAGFGATALPFGSTQLMRRSVVANLESV